MEPGLELMSHGEFRKICDWLMTTYKIHSINKLSMFLGMSQTTLYRAYLNKELVGPTSFFHIMRVTDLKWSELESIGQGVIPRDLKPQKPWKPFSNKG